MLDNIRMVTPIMLHSFCDIRIYYWKVKYFMYLYDPDLVPFNGLPNLNLFQEI